MKKIFLCFFFIFLLFTPSVCQADSSFPEEENFNTTQQESLDFNISNFNWVILLTSLIALVVFFFPLKLWQWLILLLSSIVFSLPVVLSGRLYSFGLGFWGPTGHDAIWHIGLIQQLKDFKFVNPGFAGSKLLNYHWGSDLIIGFFTKLFPITVWDSYFRLFPILIAVLIALLSFYWGKRIMGEKKAGVIFALFNFFAGSLGWVYTLIKSGSIGGESLFWSMQSVSTLINLPFAFSLVVLLFFILFWQKTEKSLVEIIALGSLVGFLVAIKIYAAVLLGFGLGGVLIYSLLTENKSKRRNSFLLFITAGVSSLLFMLLLGVFKQKRLLKFKPFWFPHSLIESLDKLYYPKLASLRINLSKMAWSLKKLFLIPLEAFLILIFIIGNFGTRIIGFVEIILKSVKKEISKIDVLLITILVFSIIFPLLFVQKGTAWNTIQFLYYGLFIANYYTAIFISRLIKNKKYLLVILIILLTIPTTYSSLKNYLGYPSPARIPYFELQALEELKKQPSGVVLTYPYDKNAKADVHAPIPLYLYETSLYVSAYSGQVSYLADEMNMEITGYLWKQRKEQILDFFQTDDKIFARGFLINNQIDYIYLVNDQKLNLQIGDLPLKEIFNNGHVRLYKVNK